MYPKLKIYLLLVLTFGGFTTCKKYPEDRHLSLQTVKHRLDKHDWSFSKLLVDGNDSTTVHLNRFTTSFSNNPSDIHFRVKNFSFNSNGSEIVLYLPCLSYAPFSFQFSLRPKKRKVFIGRVVNPNGSLQNFFIENDSEWEIEKLTKTEFIIVRSINNLMYRLEFKA